jgi:hypothetical protein
LLSPFPIEIFLHDYLIIVTRRESKDENITRQYNTKSDASEYSQAQ